MYLCIHVYIEIEEEKGNVWQRMQIKMGKIVLCKKHKKPKQRKTPVIAMIPRRCLVEIMKGHK